jgi:CubicO group peptidase (beta-lactamase class C family)
VRINTEYLDKLKNQTDLLDALLERHQVPGMGMTVIQSGRPVYTEVRGRRDDSGNPMEADTLFECASLTKSLFAVLVLRLAEEGRLDLCRPAAEQYVHDYWSNDPRYMDITPIHCLCHGTGFPNWGTKPMEISFDPGTAFSYSGEGYYLLQHMVQQLEGRPLEESFREYFYGPLDMSHTAVDWTPAVGEKMSWGYDMESKVCKIRDSHDDGGLAPEPNAAWSLYSTTEDYAKFLCCMIEERGGLSEEMFDRMTSVHNHATHGVSWGLGFGLLDAAPDVCWHWGDNGGFKNFAVWDKKTGDGAVIFTNCDRGMDLYMELLKELTDGGFYDEVRAFIEEAE